jgi:hypothetical protein
MSQTLDDLDAVRTLVNALEKFEKNDQERIIRWAREKLGLVGELQKVNAAQPSSTTLPVTAEHKPHGQKDLKSFYSEKKPGSDNQFAALVAYYYKFEAPVSDRKDEINSDILQDATRLAKRDRLGKPAKTLQNAKGMGYLDNGSARGFYKINTVGENLVAMTLPQNSK